MAGGLVRCGRRARIARASEGLGLARRGLAWPRPERAARGPPRPMACVFERRDDSGRRRLTWCDGAIRRGRRATSLSDETRDASAHAISVETEPSSTGHAAGESAERCGRRRQGGVWGLMRGADPSKVTQVRRADARR